MWRRCRPPLLLSPMAEQPSEVVDVGTASLYRGKAGRSTSPQKRPHRGSTNGADLRFIREVGSAMGRLRAGQVLLSPVCSIGRRPFPVPGKERLVQPERTRTNKIDIQRATKATLHAPDEPALYPQQAYLFRTGYCSCREGLDCPGRKIRAGRRYPSRFPSRCGIAPVGEHKHIVHTKYFQCGLRSCLALSQHPERRWAIRM